MPAADSNTEIVGEAAEKRFGRVNRRPDGLANDFKCGSDHIAQGGEAVSQHVYFIGEFVKQSNGDADTGNNKPDGVGQQRCIQAPCRRRGRQCGRNSGQHRRR